MVITNCKMKLGLFCENAIINKILQSVTFPHVTARFTNYTPFSCEKTI